MRLQAVAPPGDLALSHPDHPEYADLSAQALALRKVSAAVDQSLLKYYLVQSLGAGASP